MRFWPVTGVLGCVAAAGLSGQAAADEVSPQIREQIEEKLSDAFLAPQTTLYRFDADMAYVSGKRVVCGWVNFQSAGQKYVGYHQFYAIISAGQVILTQVDDPVSDTTGELAAKLKTLCGKFGRPG